MKRFLAVPMFALLAVSGVAHGLAFEFRGTMNFIQPVLVEFFPSPTSSPFTGAFGFNSETEDQDPNPSRGLYVGALGFGHVTVGHPMDAYLDYSAQIFDGQIIVLDEIGGIDQYHVSAAMGGECSDPPNIVGPPLNGYVLCGFTLNLIDENALAFDSDALPLTPPDLEEFTTGFLALHFRAPNGIPNVAAIGWPNQSGAQFFFIAEPGTLALFGLGLLGLALTKRSLRSAR